VKEWAELHPICRLCEMAQTLALACVDVENPTEAFFDSADQVLDSVDVSTDNIAYLFEQQSNWQDECSIQTKNLTVDEVIGVLATEAMRPENADSPLDRMRPGLRKQFLHTTAVLFATLAKVKSDSGSTGDTSTSEPPTPLPSATPCEHPEEAQQDKSHVGSTGNYKWCSLCGAIREDDTSVPDAPWELPGRQQA
jgi:hypothetical protein